MYLTFASLLGAWFLVSVLLRYASGPGIFPYNGSSYPAGTYSLLKASGAPSIAWRMIREPDSRFLLIYHHGNAEDIGQLDTAALFLRGLGFDILAYDYPGYGQSTGEPSEAGVYEAASRIYTHAVADLGYRPEQIIHYGRSLGGGPALYLATSEPAAAVIVEGTFLSINRVVTAFPMLLESRFPNLARMKKLDLPALVIHGTEDSLIPIAHARILAAAGPGPRHSFFTEAGHNDLPSVATSAYREAIANFLSTLPSP